MLGVVGSLALDLVDGEPPRIGGAVYYAAGALRRLSASPTVLARSAPADRPADFDADWLPASVTTTFSFSYEGDVRRMHVEALGDPWTPEDVGGRLEGVEWLHVGALLRSDFPAETLAALGEGRCALARRPRPRSRRAGPARSGSTRTSIRACSTTSTSSCSQRKRLPSFPSTRSTSPRSW